MKPLRVHITHTQGVPLRAWEGPPQVGQLAAWLREDTGHAHTLAASPDEADIVFFAEPLAFKDRAYAARLAEHPAVRAFPERCAAWYYDDFPVGLLPGLHAGLPTHLRGDPAHCTWCYPLPTGVAVARVAAGREHVAPDLLYVFRGSRNAAVRDTLFTSPESMRNDVIVAPPLSTGFHQQTDAQQEAYAREILRARFVLCPRGLGLGSHRLFETMELGRVPVVFSDGWTPPPGPDWPSFSLILPEHQATRVRHHLEPLAGVAAVMGRRAREAWETWFAPPVRTRRAVEQAWMLLAARRDDPATLVARWKTDAFWRAYGLGRLQSIRRAIREGRLWRVLLRGLRAGR